MRSRNKQSSSSEGGNTILGSSDPRIARGAPFANATTGYRETLVIQHPLARPVVDALDCDSRESIRGWKGEQITKCVSQSKIRTLL